MVILAVVFYIVIGFFGSRGLIKEKQWREFTAFIVLFSFGFTLIVLQTLDVEIPSPVKGIKLLVEDIMRLGYK